MSTQNTSPVVTRIVIICAIVSIAAIIGFFAIQWSVKSKPVSWRGEFFGFKSGPYCLVFPEPKLAIFIGDGGSEESFDSIDGCAGSDITAYDGRFSYDLRGRLSSRGSTKLGNVGYTRESQRGKTTLRFVGGKCEMVISERATKLTLADGREFQLDGKTPLWLRCKSDGTIDHLDELPEGFVEFFESPPPEPGLIWGVESYPEAFKK